MSSRENPFCKARKRLKLTQRAFAELLGLNEDHLGKIEAGKVATPMRALEKLAGLTGRRLAQLFLEFERFRNVKRRLEEQALLQELEAAGASSRASGASQ